MELAAAQGRSPLNAALCLAYSSLSLKRRLEFQLGEDLSGSGSLFKVPAAISSLRRRLSTDADTVGHACALDSNTSAHLLLPERHKTPFHLFHDSPLSRTFGQIYTYSNRRTTK